MGTRLLALASLVCLLVPLRAAGADFRGPETCKVCHPAAFEIWKDSQHAVAGQALSPKQQKDGRCLSCHSPQKGFPDVGCETCHGGGQYYAPAPAKGSSGAYVMKDAELARAVGLVDPSEKMCLKCHDANAPSLVPFKFVDKLKLIDHWTAERAARKERLAAAAAAADETPEKPERAEKKGKKKKDEKKPAKGASAQ